MIKKRAVSMILSVSMACSFLVVERGEANQNSAEVRGSANTMIEYNQVVLTPMDFMCQIFQRFQSKRTQEIVGGWAINQDSTLPKDNPEAMQVFKKATRDLEGYRYQVVAVLGLQVVAGMNYSYLCTAKMSVPQAKTEYHIVTVYENLNGEASVTSAQNLLPVSQEGMTGGWQYNQGKPELKAHPKVQETLKQATQDLLDTAYTPIAYIGTQVTNGTNYAVVCRIKPEYPKAIGEFYLVTVHRGTDGQIALGEVSMLDIAVKA